VEGKSIIIFDRLYVFGSVMDPIFNYIKKEDGLSGSIKTLN